jgi:MFS superfamily sulfate permease-like transporter
MKIVFKVIAICFGVFISCLLLIWRFFRWIVYQVFDKDAPQEARRAREDDAWREKKRQEQKDDMKNQRRRI